MLAWALRELQLHQRAKGQGVPRKLISHPPQRGPWPPTARAQGLGLDLALRIKAHLF